MNQDGQDPVEEISFGHSHNKIACSVWQKLLMALLRYIIYKNKGANKLELLKDQFQLFM